MTEAYIQNYKAIRNKFFAPPKPVIIPKTEDKAPPVPEPVITENLSEIERWARHGAGHGNYRDMLVDAATLRTEAEKRGITFYTRLMEGMPVVSNRIKLAVVVVLDEYAIDWISLFDKERCRFKSAIRWKIFEALREEGLSLKEIAKLCNVDHTSVIHGLRKIEGEKNVGR